MVQDFSYYKKVLNIQGTYDENSLKKAFYRAVKENHPDKFQNPINKKLATEKMKIINEAYEYLKKNINNQAFDSKSESSKNNSQEKQTYENTYSSNYEQKSQNKTHNEEQTRKQSSRNTKSNNNRTTQNTDDSGILKDLEFCINNHKTIQIKYKLKTGEEINIDIVPQKLVYGLYGQDAMYLKALYFAQNKVKTYRVDRILKIKILEETDDETEFYNQNNSFKKAKNNSEYESKDIWDLNVLLPLITGITIIICFFKVPYTFYMVLKVLVCLTLLNAVLTLRKFLPIWAIVLCIGGIILFNPIYPFHLERSLWQLLDVGILIIIIRLLNGYFKNE